MPLPKNEELSLAHVRKPFCDYHLLCDEQADQIFATIDVLAERVRKLGRPTIRSIGHIASLQRKTAMSSS